MLDGELAVTVAGADYRLAAGDCLRHKLSGRTRIANPGATMARYVIVNSTAS
ncbi:MAG: cupin domain-containing protein [Sphingopyxis sp.]